MNRFWMSIFVSFQILCNCMYLPKRNILSFLLCSSLTTFFPLWKDLDIIFSYNYFICVFMLLNIAVLCVLYTIIQCIIFIATPITLHFSAGGYYCIVSLNTEQVCDISLFPFKLSVCFYFPKYWKLLTSKPLSSLCSYVAHISLNASYYSSC